MANPGVSDRNTDAGFGAGYKSSSEYGNRDYEVWWVLLVPCLDPIVGSVGSKMPCNRALTPKGHFIAHYSLAECIPSLVKVRERGYPP